MSFIMFRYTRSITQVCQVLAPCVCMRRGEESLYYSLQTQDAGYRRQRLALRCDSDLRSVLGCWKEIVFKVDTKHQPGWWCTCWTSQSPVRPGGPRVVPGAASCCWCRAVTAVTPLRLRYQSRSQSSPRGARERVQHTVSRHITGRPSQSPDLSVQSLVMVV